MNAGSSADTVHGNRPNHMRITAVWITELATTVPAPTHHIIVGHDGATMTLTAKQSLRAFGQKALLGLGLNIVATHTELTQIVLTKTIHITIGAQGAGMCLAETEILHLAKTFDHLRLNRALGRPDTELAIKSAPPTGQGAVIETTGMIQTDTNPPWAPLSAAIGRTAVARKIVAVVAGLNSLTNGAISASRHDAVAQAVVGIGRVAIITGLNAGLNLTITAASRLAATKAGVGLIAVAIVAGLNTFMNQTVTANGQRTITQTCVALNGIAVIAAFDALLHDAITTRGSDAAVKAGVGIDVIAIIAGLTRLQNSITAGG